MSVINILDKSVYNKIAAGEVVEKPASVVKELVENSIDANATSISIDIVNGGISKIKVSDNGCGIAYDDFDKVFLAHATSKVKDIEDLEKIGTLGFRGEALSSIASVSKVTLSSKTQDADEGYQVIVEGGEMGEIVPIGATTGTNLTIEDLFYNIPARKKFLRKAKMEENDITNYVARLILANPNISIRYSADNKIVYQSFGNGLYDAIYAIYGKSIVDNIFEFEFKKGDFQFNGYLGKPTFSKPNRTYQTLIINGRYVINQTISTAVYKAYENFLMKGMFPFFVINLQIPLDKVDVNVHPNKLDVKFEDSNSLFGLVYSFVSDILYNINNTKKINTDIADVEEVDISKLTTISSGSVYSEAKSNNDEIEEIELDKIDDYEFNKTNKENIEFENNLINSSNGHSTSNMIDGAVFKPFVSSKDVFEFKVECPKSPITDATESTPNIVGENFNELNSFIQSKFLDTDFKIVGSVFNTYIIVEKEQSLYFIDQHAGHERILFDKFSVELENKAVAVQALLVPYVFEANYQESNFIEDNMQTLVDMGFEIEEFGLNSYKISSVPMLFDDFNVGKYFDNILHDIDNKLIKNNNSIRDYLAKTACKNAVKGNYRLTNDEIKVLIDKLNNSQQILLCPHGRPIVVEVSNKEIEKWFKRIV